MFGVSTCNESTSAWPARSRLAPSVALGPSAERLRLRDSVAIARNVASSSPDGTRRIPFEAPTETGVRGSGSMDAIQARERPTLSRLAPGAFSKKEIDNPDRHSYFSGHARTPRDAPADDMKRRLRLMSLASCRASGLALCASAPMLFRRCASQVHAQSAGAHDELGEALENTTERIDEVGNRLAQLGDRAFELLPVLAIALLTVAVFAVLAYLLTRGEALFRWIKNRFVRDMVRHFTRVALIGVGILLALELLDATALVGAALGAAGVVGIAVGFAFRDIIENYLAGLLLSLRHPFEPNDLVSVDGEEGKVVRLTSRATILLTLAGNHLRIPNSRVFKAVLLNFTQNPLRRIDFEIGIGSAQDLGVAQELAVDALSSMDAILAEPEPLCLIEGLGGSSASLHLYAWLDQRDTDFFKARSEAIRIVKGAFDDAGIDMRSPIYQVTLDPETERREPRAAHAVPEPAEVGDTAADITLDEQVESERAAQGPDLLDVEAPHE